MIVNNLSKEEFGKFLSIILSTKDGNTLKEEISSLLHLKNSKIFENRQYVHNSTTTGIKNHYDEFEIEIRKINDPDNGYSGTIISFRKEKKILDIFRNSLKNIFQIIKEKCEQHIDNCKIQEFYPGGFSAEGEKDHFFIQSSALNPNWKETDKLSSLTIYTCEYKDRYLVELIFDAQCYYYENKVRLKDNWLDYLSIY